jgi:hypothetical protein
MPLESLPAAPGSAHSQPGDSHYLRAPQLDEFHALRFRPITEIFPPQADDFLSVIDMTSSACDRCVPTISCCGGYLYGDTPRPALSGYSSVARLPNPSQRGESLPCNDDVHGDQKIVFSR